MMLFQVTLDISTPGYLVVARLYISVICTVLNRPQWLDLLAYYNDGPISRLIFFLFLTTAHLDLANPLAPKTYESTI